MNRFNILVTSQVILKPRPWRARYEIKDYLGIEPFPLGWRRAKRAKKVQKIPTKYDLMWQYRLVELKMFYVMFGNKLYD